jgi:hypothetical protein
VSLSSGQAGDWPFIDDRERRTVYHPVLPWLAIMLGLSLACNLARVTPQPTRQFDQLSFEVQTATPTVGFLSSAPTNTPDPRFTPTLTATLEITTTLALTESAVLSPTATLVPTVEPAPPPEVAEASSDPPTATPRLDLPPAEPLRGGAWDFEDGFAVWSNPHGEVCPGSGLAAGWVAFTSRDQYGSSCMNRTVWAGNVYSGTSAQEITFAYVGVEAGVYRSAPTIPGHRYTVEAFMKREFSPAKLEVSLGLDPTGGADWQAESVQWFPWNEDFDDEWSRTEATVMAETEAMTVFIKGNHPYPEPGGTLRLDSISVTDIGP